MVKKALYLAFLLGCSARIVYAGDIYIPNANGGGGGGGTVTSVSSGNATPLFTVNVATPNTTPAFTFTQSTAAANTAFGNFTGGIAAPTFATSATVRSSLGLAASGANSDITSISGLLTPLSAAQGGTGISAPGANGNVLTSNGAGAWTSAAPASSGTVTSVTGGTGIVITGVPTVTPQVNLVVPVSAANGGTNLTTSGATLGNLLTADGGGSWSSSPPGTTTVITVPGGIAGNLFWAMPMRGGDKRVVVVLEGYNDVAGTTITFPTTFSHVPSITSNATGLLLAAPTTTQLVIPGTAGVTNGVITVEGI